ncbi:DeoR/GlpR transcriptional regulator [Burkholderia sp. LS-044]|uniref:DeoR/GlpR family DNA-binding transcription regulator n=1 Tax=Burkholderia sp. LS-044 TaxID=1459967 RepID=UPI0010A5E83F|nr:DeoR/GlpR family DNA-binding transcription regulator [Burkholderia sp. LS-044]THJ50164.1 DeoR/GlpR transcriptional regulator [Burkholderia sp. LS-044]
MWQEERYQRIRLLLSKMQRVSTDRIMADLNVSRETVRRDLVDLEALGELKRVHGGAVQVGDEAPIAERAQTHVKAKLAIARAAARLVTGSQTLFIDAGTTTTLLAEELAKLSGLTIVTNSIDVALKMRSSDPGQARNETILLGGMIGTRAAATVGDGTVAEIFRYRADLALLSPVGVDAVRGATNYDRMETEVARAMVSNAADVAILADFSKLGTNSRISFCDPARIGALVTDAKAESVDSFKSLKKVIKNIVLS